MNKAIMILEEYLQKEQVKIPKACNQMEILDNEIIHQEIKVKAIKNCIELLKIEI